MARHPGSGRKPGTPNKFTSTFKQAVLRCYDGIGGDDGFQAWARKNRTAFYKIAARLIPTEISVRGNGLRPLVIDRVATREQLIAAVGQQEQDPAVDWGGEDDGPVH